MVTAAASGMIGKRNGTSAGSGTIVGTGTTAVSADPIVLTRDSTRGMSGEDTATGWFEDRRTPAIAGHSTLTTPVTFEEGIRPIVKDSAGGISKVIDNSEAEGVGNPKDPPGSAIGSGQSMAEPRL